MTKELVGYRGIILEPALIDLVGRRYKTLDLLKEDIETITHRVDTIKESETERYETDDYEIEFCYENDEEKIIHIVYYIRDNAGQYYITRV